jgi:hypothetical protein
MLHVFTSIVGSVRVLVSIAGTAETRDLTADQSRFTVLDRTALALKSRIK